MLAVPVQALFGQVLIGLINGSFYALLSLGLAIIFGLLNVINFAHGALYMLGAFVAWFLLEKAGIGYWPALLLAPLIVGMFGVFGLDVPRLATAAYAVGVALAALAGVMAAPIYRVSPLMGADLIVVVFAVVVIGGMGSIIGSIITGFSLGVVEGLTKVFYPEASNTVVFVLMVLVLLIKPTGLTGRAA